VQRLNQWIIECSRGKSWVVRLPLWFFFAFLLTRYVRDPRYYSIFGGLNLGIHELGHLLFSPLGLTYNIAGGTLIQIAAPLASFWIFINQRDAFALAFSSIWLATNMFGVAEYIADARAMIIPLVSPFGGHVYHDWNYLLGKVNGLSYDQIFGNGVKLTGYLFMVLGVAYGAWVLWLMATSRDNIE